MPLVYLKLTKAQHSGLQKGKGTRMNPSSQGSGQLCGVEMNATDYKRYSKALLAGKGCIVKGSVVTSESDDEVEGGKINWKKVGRQIKKGINTYGVDSIEAIQKYVPEEVAKNAVQYGVGSAVLAGTTFAGMPNPQLAMAAGRAAGVGVDAGYKTDFRQRNGLKQFGKNYIEGAQQEAMASSMSGGKINFKKVAKRGKKFSNTIIKDTLENVKKYVPKEELQAAIKKNAQAAVMRATDNAELADRIGRYSENVVDAGYNTDFNQKHAVRNVGRQLKDVKNEIINDGVDYALNSAMNGGALKKPKFVKGSPEAKAYMQQLRARRKSTGGAGLVKQSVHAIENKIVGKGFVPLGGGMVPLGRGMVPL